MCRSKGQRFARGRGLDLPVWPQGPPQATAHAGVFMCLHGPLEASRNAITDDGAICGSSLRRAMSICWRRLERFLRRSPPETAPSSEDRGDAAWTPYAGRGGVQFSAGGKYNGHGSNEFMPDDMQSGSRCMKQRAILRGRRPNCNSRAS